MRLSPIHPARITPARVTRLFAARMLPAAAVGLGAVAMAVAGCGSAAATGGGASTTSGAAAATASGGARSTTSAGAASTAPAVAELGAAESPGLAQFPPAGGRSLRQLGKLVASTVQLGAATGTFTPGLRRFAFALTTGSGRFVYAPTSIYVSTSPTAPAKGPFLAPADPLGVAPQYRSRQNDGPGGIQAIYATDLPLPRAGTYVLLALTRTTQGLIGATSEVAVAAASPIPDVGQRPPAIATDTAATVHGDTALLTTRLPPEQMASVAFSQVLGRRPIALLFSTPQLCTSRVCGPVTDVTVALQRRFGSRVTFIHQEVYVDNQPSKGLRPQMKAFHLQTEPWLFMIDRRGVITSRLEGTFGTAELTRALQRALR